MDPGQRRQLPLRSPCAEGCSRLDLPLGVAGYYMRGLVRKSFFVTF